ncbi:MAG: hypothetical protein V4726_15400 [Verrucomicrobiota bacterium]
MARVAGGAEASRRAAMISTGSLLPALFAGSIAATLGMMLLRRDEDFLEFRELPKVARWGLRGMLGLGLAASLLTLWSPLKPPDTSVAGKPFSYTVPEGLKTGSPAAWEITARRSLGSLDPDIIVASSDQTLLAGMSGDRTIVIHHLEKEYTRRFPSLPYPARWLAFSPDARRLFVVMNGDPRRLAVVVIETGEIIELPQPKMHAVPKEPVLWAEENKVLFFSPGRESKVYNLKSLELDPATPEEEKLKLLWHPLLPTPQNAVWSFEINRLRVSAELPETMGTADWPSPGLTVLSLKDRKYAESRFFPEISVLDTDKLLGTSDGSKTLQFRNGNVEVFYFGLQTVPPLRWKIQFPHGTEKMPRQRDVQAALELNHLKLHLYPPLINPLTKETVGPDRSRLKSVLGVSRWEGREAEVWIERLNESCASGDVLADVFIEGDATQLVSFDQPHRWWTVVPEPPPDATSTDKFPTWKEIWDKRLAASAKPLADARSRTPEPASPAAQAATKSSTDASFSSESPVPEGAALPTRDSGSRDLRSIEIFVVNHHSRMSENQLAPAVEDYADKVDFFDTANADRQFILNSERDYHGKYEYVRETVDIKDIVSRALGPDRFQVQYQMRSEYKALDGKTGGGKHTITLILRRKNSGGWEIVSHKMPKP